MASSLFLLLPISLVFVIAIGVFFWWAIFSGQFDDSQSGGDSILLDQDRPDENPAGLAGGQENRPQEKAAAGRDAG
ncbi:cytochrome oxidase maturation protein, cbb3-type [Pollutimonas bauzanensis]|uniref:Cytochrome oxidase maturation protein, cbb3-type n=1 Tax=Pollutimonas bauzanensis TaxID=658167 RepID=A0A1M5N7B5_9BURK|nr:cbb3-type cytochrome oxidase assembly protein CcoS [Pollutimonas bauzanensis]SHG85342.1 cytochrome oxidase maturation protein, cbb3-type [Pollutimonas bauzanensis]